jgi:hypothetical protein
MAFLEVVVVVAIVEAVVDLLRSLAELISIPSRELYHLEETPRGRTEIQVPQERTPCLSMPGVEGQRAGRHTQ